MTKVTEQDVIMFLEEKVASIQVELSKAQSALDAFRGTALSAPGSAKMAVNSSLKNQAAAIELAALKQKRGRKPRASVKAAVEAPTEYNSKLKFDKKIAYALAKAGPSFKEDVFKVLNDLEPEVDPKKLDKDVTVKLSSMFKKGLVKAEREGRKYRYSL
ncbi:hypothetical protein [Hufsiella ginkgonis]|uniref:Uncharacterized protein n=1 Tax=Hufsiella ginkgonis TaxID=2695274 RepID=A0A7K1XWI8_9SPHI|nr:hypothetical protein [Hufsiella ginkgonis]MXV15177.1 hypothetical protein [Hufsiella ginkgonis]